MSPRRFPPPWSVEERPACFVVRDQNGQQLAYVYFEEEPGRRSAAKLLTRDEARRIAVNIAKFPEFLKKPPKIAEHLLWREHGELLLEGPRQEPSIGLF